MRACIASVLLLCIGNVAVAEIIPAARRVTWQGTVGVPGGIPNVTTVYTNFDSAPTQSAMQAGPRQLPEQSGRATGRLDRHVQFGPATQPQRRGPERIRGRPGEARHEDHLLGRRVFSPGE